MFCWAADHPLVGKWDCTSDDGSGQERNWTLMVKEDGGKLSGSLLGTAGEIIPLIEPALEGSMFTFKMEVNANCMVAAKVKVEGNKFEGKFACPEVSGTLKGSRKS